MVTESTQNALERFFPRIGKADIRMNRQAFGKARHKIRWHAVDELHQTSVSGFYHEDGSSGAGFGCWRWTEVLSGFQQTREMIGR